MAVFADFQHCIYADIVGMGGSEKVPKYADVINRWSLFEIRQVVVSHKKLSDMDFGFLENNCNFSWYVPIHLHVCTH